MKKILTSLLLAGLFITPAFAASSLSTLSVNSQVQTNCTTTLNGTSNGTMAFGNLMLNTQPTQPGSTYLLTCTADTVITSIAVTSTNQFQLKNGSDVINYSITAAYVGYTPTAPVTTWNSGSVMPGANVIGTATIDNLGTPLQINLTGNIQQNDILASLNSGEYTDSVSITANY